MTNTLLPKIGGKASFTDVNGLKFTGRVNAISNGKALISVRRSASTRGGMFRIPLDKVTAIPDIDPREHSDKGLETLTAMKTVPSDWGLTAIKWELRKVVREVWVLCPLCAGAGEIGTVKGKTVPRHEAWNTGAGDTIRTCTKCPKLHFTRKGREYYRENEETKVWENTRREIHGYAHSNGYSSMNGLVSELHPIMKEVGIVQWAAGTKFDSRFEECGFDVCALCSKVIPSRQFAPVTGKGADGTIHGMWVGMDCARKFFGIKNFKENQVIERKEIE